jgi:hypothetical protein
MITLTITHADDRKTRRVTDHATAEEAQAVLVAWADGEKISPTSPTTGTVGEREGRSFWYYSIAEYQSA